MTDIAKVVVDGEEHWTAAGSPKHQELLTRQQAAEQETGDAGQEDGGQDEGDAGAQQQEPKVPGDGDDHDAGDAGGEPGDGKTGDAGTAGGTRRSRPSQSASGS